MYGHEFYKLSIINGHTALYKSIELFGNDHEFTKLNLSLKNRDPDDAFSSVPYEKGCALLLYLEKMVDNPKVFNEFIKKYLDHYKFKCLDSNEFKNYCIDYFKNKGIDIKMDWKKWLKGTGTGDLLSYKSKLIDNVNELVEKWILKDSLGFKDAHMNDLNEWVPQQIEMFLDALKKRFDEMIFKLDADNGNKIKNELKENVLLKLMDVYGFDKSQNSEIVYRLSLLILACDDTNHYNIPLKMLQTVGRMKFVRPLYRNMIVNKDRINIANECFIQNKDGYHPICAKMVAKDLGLSL